MNTPEAIDYYIKNFMIKNRIDLDSETFFYDCINEGLIKSYNMLDCKKHLMSKFPLITNITNVASMNAISSSRKKCCFMIHVNKFKNRNEIEQIERTIENLYGWYITGISVSFVKNGSEENESYVKIENDYETNYMEWQLLSRHLDKQKKLFDDNGNCKIKEITSAIIYIEAKFTKKFIINKNSNLFHATYKKNIKSIKENGLEPRTKYNYPDKIYFCNSIDHIKEMIPIDNEMVFLKLNIKNFFEEISEKNSFYEDVRDEDSIYTYDCIHPKFIEILYNGEWHKILN